MSHLDITNEEVPSQSIPDIIKDIQLVQNLSLMSSIMNEL